MAQTKLSTLKNGNRDFNNVLDNFINLEDGLNVDHHVTLASVDAAHLGDASGYNKWTVKGQLQGAVADEAVSADFAVVNSRISEGSLVMGNLTYTQATVDANAVDINSLSQSSMIIKTHPNSMSFCFANATGVAVVDDTQFTASFWLLK